MNLGNDFVVVEIEEIGSDECWDNLIRSIGAFTVYKNSCKSSFNERACKSGLCTVNC